MTKAINTLSQWLSQQPIWLQRAANRLIENDVIDEIEIAEFSKLCKQESNGQLNNTDNVLPPEMASTDLEEKIKLLSVSGVEGINALSPRKPLELGKANVYVIYGLNGSGKSSYVRLLKHICGVRNPGSLHQNVFSNKQKDQKATIKFEKDGKVITNEWTSELSLIELKNVDIYDNIVGRTFMSNENEVCYEPPILSFLTSMISICEKVSKILDADEANHTTCKLFFPLDLKETKESIWYHSLSCETSHTEMESNCTFTEEDKYRLDELIKRHAESDPKDIALKVRNHKSHLDNLIKDIHKHFSQLSNENCKKIIEKRLNSEHSRSNVEEALQILFKDDYLADTGSNIWKSLWEAARKYSTSSAYKDLEYPNISDNSRCVLCQQELSNSAKARFSKLNDFVMSELEDSSRKANEELASALASLDDLPTLEMLKTRIDAAGINYDKFSIQMFSLFSSMRKRKESLNTIKSIKEIPEVFFDHEWFDSLKKFTCEYEIQAENYENDAKQNKSEVLGLEIKTLQAKKWLASNSELIKSEIERLKFLNQIQSAKKLANTKSLSIKKGELAEVLITDAFIQRFNDELKKLNATSIRVELVKSKVSKGKVLHKIRLCNVSGLYLSEVLSEGESKIVSIAAFLADIAGKSSKAPFIFDDPTSSLDQVFEEAVAKRLLELSLDRQVIILTHRLPLLSIIKHYADKKKVMVEVGSIKSVDWGKGEPAPIPISQNEIKSTLNVLINNRISEVNKAYDNGEFEKSETITKSICSDFRNLIERVVENDLICGVVQRHQISVQTLKIHELHKINRNDCNTLTLLMTKYSSYEHSQSQESPVELPHVNELLKDLICLRDWREEFSSRSSTL